MFERIITFAVRQRLLVALGVLALIAWGLNSLRTLPIDAVPDITNNQVQIVTVTPALAPQEVERLITMPVELTMASIPGIHEMRSISRFGLSVVTIVFDDGVDVYWARAQADQRLTEVMDQIPQGAGTPLLAPVTTGLGEIYQYSLHVKPGYESRYSLTELRTIQDWIVRRRILGTPGVADVSSFGGNLLQAEIAIDPQRLRSMNHSISDVLDAVQRNNQNAGGAYIEKGPNVQYIRTEGIVTSLEDIGAIEVSRSDDGLPILVRDVATVKEGRAVRYGAMTRDDRGETVGGIVLMLKGANSSEVIATVKERIEAVQRTLPEGVVIEPYLDRTRLVNKAITTVSKNLIEGALIVIFVLVLLLGNLRAGLIVASVIPLSMLFAIGMMRMFGVSGNLMSLGAIDFGLIVDGAVIIVESVLHRLQNRGATRDTAREAAIGIRRSAAFGEVIIMIVYLPILALVGIEGKMFAPMAQTVIFAIIGAFILSTTYVPMMSSWLLKPGLKTWSLADRVMDAIARTYAPVRRLALRWQWATLGGTAVVFVAGVTTFLSMGGEFLPQLDEGDFAVEMRLMTGTSLTETIATAERAARILETQFPEVERVIGKIGTSEIPLDPMPMESGDLIVVLKDKDQWTSAHSREELAEKMQHALAALPGVTFGFQQPIQMRFNELMTGARQDVVVKMFGEDMDSLATIAQRIGGLASTVQGAADVYVEPVQGLPQITVAIDRQACARLGVDVETINTTVRAAFAGAVAGTLYNNERRFDIVLRLDTAYRHDPEDVAQLMVPNRTDELVPITQVAAISIALGPNQIQRENAQRRISVGFNVRGRDVESIVNELESHVAKSINLPPGYYITYGGQFENLAAAKQRLAIAVPIALVLILFLLYLTFHNIIDALLIFTAVPLSAIGGVAALVIRGMPFSISAGVGFIALFGVAVLNGIVLLSAFRSLRTAGRTNTLRIVMTATQSRLRPVAMTAMVASLGFLPMAISTGDGSEVQRPLATVVIGGLITATMLTLLVLPTLYVVVSAFQWKKLRGTAASISVLLMIAMATPAHADREPLEPISLDSAIALARQLNVDRYAAITAEREADALGSTSVDIAPTTVTYMRGQYNSYLNDNNLTITQPLPNPFKVLATSAYNDASLREAQLARMDMDAKLRRDVAQAYAEVCLARERVAITIEHEVLLDRAVQAASLRESTGDVSALDRRAAEAQRSDVRIQRIQAASELRRAELHLRMICGTSRRITSVDSLVPLHAVNPDASPRVPLRLELATQRTRVADEYSNVTSAAYWPDLSVSFFTQTLAGIPLAQPGQIASSSERFTGFMIGLAVPLWFVPTRARDHAASLQRDLAEQRAMHEDRLVRAWQQQLMSELTVARTAVEHYRDFALPEAQRMASAMQTAYQQGDVDWLDVQTALLRLLSIRIMDAQARKTLFDLTTSFDYLLGIQ
jgi:cobalt-zinc-cadmium resistance protein CzcA